MSRSTKKKHQNQHIEATLDGLNHWFETMFEKLGWMLLAKKHGYLDKVKAYRNSIKRLEEAIRYRHSITTNPDIKIDLEIMLKNVLILKDHKF